MLYQFDELEGLHPWPLKILYLYEEYLQESLSRPSGTGYYQWIYCIKGEGMLVLQEKTYRIYPNTGFLIVPGEQYSLIQNAPDWTTHIITFGGICCKEILACLGLETSGAYIFQKDDLFFQYMEKIKKTKTNHFFQQGRILSTICYEFLVAMASNLSCVEQEQAYEENTMVIQIIAYLEANFAKPITLEDVASHMHMSKEYLCTQFKKHTGTSIFKHLTKIRIGNAKVLFRQYPYESVASIARKCGFESPSYFGKIFRQETGVTPNTYRKINTAPTI